MSKIQDLFSQERVIMDMLDEKDLGESDRAYYEKELESVRFKIGEEEGRAVNEMDKYAMAKLVLDVRISKCDHADDINEALDVAKEALQKQSDLLKSGVRD